MNLTIQKGRLVRDPELKTVGAKNTSLCRFTLAVPDRLTPKDKEKTFFANCVAWGKLGDIIGQYCTKGQEILITGRLAVEAWTKDNVKHKNTIIVCDSMEFCGGKFEAQKGEGQKAADDQEPPW